MDSNKEANFHKSRIAFMIINEKIEYLANSTFSHEQWYTKMRYLYKKKRRFNGNFKR